MSRIVKAATTPAQIIEDGKIGVLPISPKRAEPVVISLTKNLTCPICQTVYEITMSSKVAEANAHLEQCGVALKHLVCARCSSRQRAPDENRIVVRSWFERNCPIEFQKPFDPKLCKSLKATDEVMRWNFRDGKGVVLYGETRHGKTRAVWRALQQLDKQGVKIEAWNAEQWAMQCSRLIGESMSAAIDWLNASSEVPVLFIDDIDKMTLTSRVQSELFYLINKRCADNKPMIITTNQVGKGLAAKFEIELGNALVERLRDPSLFCDAIKFVGQ